MDHCAHRRDLASRHVSPLATTGDGDPGSGAPSTRPLRCTSSRTRTASAVIRLGRSGRASSNASPASSALFSSRSCDGIFLVGRAYSVLAP
ncbi:unnamed protein product [Schistocephalus solidus]|uniref:Uncharacterized protein n=1 Tax=Schistocephalus solidus TaxID=70667 RepID=A0A183TK06_SCHSO|nr:unnamed protein product [Schistocephalus solidus]